MKRRIVIILVVLLLFTSAMEPANAQPVEGTDDEGRKTFRFDYTGNVQTWVVPETGRYKLEVWGAQGGRIGTREDTGGRGGYAYGELELEAGETLYIYVGGKGGNSRASIDGWYGRRSPYNDGGWNGGGHGAGSRGPGGGGATDIRRGGTTYDHRIIVAGGGAGGFLNHYGSSHHGGNTTNLMSGPNGQDGCLHQFGSNLQWPSDTAGGGGGYRGGRSVCGDDPSRAYGGSNYIGGVENGGEKTGVREGHGQVLITQLVPFKVNWNENNQFPSLVTKETDITVRIAFSNPADAQVWDSDVRLRVEWVKNGQVVHHQMFSLPQTIYPGGSVDQNFTIAVPDLSSGTYEVRYKLIRQTSGSTADKMQVFENIEVVEGLNISFSDQNTFPKEWLVSEKRQVVIAFQNNENRSMEANTHKIIVEWKQGSNTVHRQEINISLPVGAGTVYRRTHELQPPSTPGDYTVIYSVRHNNGLESVEKQIFENIVVHDLSTSWQISALHDQVEGNLVTWTGKRFDPNRDVDVNIQDDKVAVKVSYHVPMFFPVTRLFGGGDWQPMITVTSEQQVHKEKPAW